MNLTLLVKTLESGQVAASVLEFPGYRVEAASRSAAIASLQATLIDHLQDAETLSWQIPVNLPLLSTHPWPQLFGLFKDDAYFEEVLDLMQADREALGDEDLDAAYYAEL